MHPDFQTFNPFRVPQWRCDRTLELVEHRPLPLKPSPRRDDEYVRAYHKFLLKFLRAENEAQRLALFPKNPAMFYAHLLHHHPDKEWESILQARLLTDADDEEIGQLICTLPEAVHIYERLFFNVRDRLDNKDYIVKTVLGTAIERASNRIDSITEHQQDLLYKLFGYFGGPMILDVVISGFVAGDLPQKPKDISGWFDRCLKTLLKRKAAMSAAVFETTKFQVMQLFEIHLGIMNAEKSDNDGPQTDIENSINAMLQQVPWSLAARQRKQLTPIQERYADSAIEPRADEQMALAAGHVPKQLAYRERILDQENISLVVAEE